MFDRYVRQFAGVFLVAGVLLLAGCPSPPKSASRVTPLGSSLAVAPVRPVINEAAVDSAQASQPADLPQAVFAATAPTTSPELIAQQVATPTRIEFVLPEAPLQLPGGEVRVKNWAKLCGFDSMRLVPGTTPQALELQGDSGVLTLTYGKRYAQWNGLNVGLGFAPMIRGGDFVMHSTDVVKNIQPLAQGRIAFPPRKRILMLDPGHGGADPGSLCGNRSCTEKDLALDWALRIEQLLANSAWEVVLTRRSDRDLSLMERVALADTHQADLFISLHFNAFEQAGSSGEEQGIETYCLTPAGLPSNIQRNFEDDLRRVYPNNDFDTENLLLATSIHNNLVKATGSRDRGVRRARFMTVLREQKRPAVLIEGGFLSSRAESRRILDPAYRQRMAQAVCAALPN